MHQVSPTLGDPGSSQGRVQMVVDCSKGRVNRSWQTMASKSRTGSGNLTFPKCTEGKSQIEAISGETIDRGGAGLMGSPLPGV